MRAAKRFHCAVISSSTGLGKARKALMLAASAALFGVPALHAATLNWDPTLTNTATGGGSGTWDLATTPNWFNGASDVQWTDSAGATDIAAFGGTAGTVSLGSNLGALQLLFTSAGYSITGGNTLTLGASGIDASALHNLTTTLSTSAALTGNQSWNVGVGATLLASGSVSQTAASTLTKTGAGILTLSGTNSFGGLTHSAGQLNINSASALGGGPVSFGAVTIDNTNGGAVVNGGANAITLTGASLTFLGATNGSHDLNLGSGTVSFAGGVTIISRAGNLTLGPLSGGANNLSKQGGGMLTIDNASNAYGNTTVQGGTLALGTTGVLGSTSSTLGLNNGELSITGGNAGARAVQSGALTASAGRDIVTLTADPGQNIKYEATSINATRAINTTTLFRGTNLGATSIASATAGNANIVFTTAPTAGIANILAANGSGTTGTTQAAVFRGGLFDASATGNGTAFATYDATVGVRALNPATEQVTAYPGSTSLDNVRLDLTGPTSITGVQTNTLQLNNTSGTAVVVTNSGTALKPVNGLLFTGTSAITLAGGTNTFAAAEASVTGAGDGLIMSTNTAGVTITTGLTVSGAVERGWTFAGPGNITVNAAVAGQGGNGGVFINGPGTVTLNGAVTTSSKGIVVLGGTGKLGSSFTMSSSRLWQVASGATLDLNGTNAVNVEGLIDFSGAGGTFTNSGGLATLTITRGSNGGSARTFSGVITGNLNLTLNAIAAGTAAQTLSNQNTYTGATTISSGTLALGVPNALPTGTALAVNGGGALPGVLDLRGFNQTVGSLSGTSTGQSILNSNAGAGFGSSILTVGGSGSGAYAGVIVDNAGTGGAVGLARSGSGLLALSGNNTYSLGTTVTGGTLLANNATGSTGSGAVSVTNATLGGTGKILGATTLSGTSHLAPGDSTVPANAVGTLSFGSSLVLAPTTTLDYEFVSTSSNDMAATTGALTINGFGTSGDHSNSIGINIYQPNTTTEFSPIGTTTYNLFSFGSLAGAGAGNIADAFKVLNPLATKNYTFGTSGSFVTLTIISLNPTLTWTGAASDGSWNTANNWDDGSGGHTVPNAVGATAVFAAAAPGIVTLNGDKTVGSLSFNNTSSSFTVSGANVLFLDNAAAHVGVTNSGGTHTISSAVALGSGAVGGNLSPVVDVAVSNSTDTLTLSGVVSGNGSIVKSGNGVLALTNSNNYVGSTTINAGTVQINSATSLGVQTTAAIINAGTLEVLNSVTTSRNFQVGSSGSTVQVDGASTLRIDGMVSNGASTGTLNLTTSSGGSGTVTLTGANAHTGGTTVGTGVTLNIGAAGGSTGTVSTGPVTIDGTVNVLRTGTLSIPGTLSGAGPLSIASGGTLSVSGANTAYTGTVSVTGSTLNLAGNSVTGSGAGNLNLDNATVTSTASGPAGAVIGNGANNSSTVFSTTTITGAVILDPGTGGLTIASQLVGAPGTTITRSSGTGVLALGVSGNTTFTNGNITGGVPFGFQGTFTNSSGPISFLGRGSGSGAADWIFTASDPVSIAALGASINFGSLAGTSQITGGSARLTVGATGHNSAYSGNITGNFGLNKQGSGMLTLSGQNAFTFDAITALPGVPVVVSSGTLVAASSTGATTGPLGPGSSNVLIGSNSVVGTATLDIDGAFTVTNPIAISGGTAAAAGAYTLTLGGLSTTATATFSGPVQLQNNLTVAQAAGGTLNLGGGMIGTIAQFGPGGISVDNTGNQLVTFAGPGTINVSGAITDGGDPNVNGGLVSVAASGGTTTLSNTNTYAGNTTVNGGTLTISASGSVASATLTANTGGTLNVVGGTAPAAVFNASGGTVAFGGNTTAVTANRTIATLNIGSNGLGKILSSTFPFTPRVLQPTTLTFADSTAKFDLTNNELIVPSTTLSAVRTQVSGAQIITSTSGLAVGSLDLGGGNVEVRATLLGDTNLDGKVDVTDLGNLASNYGATSGATWVQGDTNYSNAVDVTDLGNLASNYGGQLAMGPSAGGDEMIAGSLASVASGAGAAVPEPTALTLLGIGAVGLLGRRRRK